MKEEMENRKQVAAIKPIETVYKGYRFRSRLEARRAVFFDAVGIKWEYEPEGFEKNRKKYLPDFYLPEYDWYVEIKPPRDGAGEDIERLVEFVDGVKIKVVLLLGNIPEERQPEVFHFYTLYYNIIEQCVSAHSVCLTPTGEERCERGEFIGWLAVDVLYDPHINVYNLARRKNVVEKLLIARHDLDMYEDGMAWCESGDDGFDFWNGLHEAYKKARQARFEHGETPKGAKACPLMEVEQ